MLLAGLGERKRADLYIYQAQLIQSSDLKISHFKVDFKGGVVKPPEW